MFASYLSFYWKGKYGVGEGDSMVPGIVIGDFIFCCITGEFPKGGFKKHGGARGASRDSELPYQHGTVANMISSLRTLYRYTYPGQFNECDSVHVLDAMRVSTRQLGNSRRHAALPIRDGIVTEIMKCLDMKVLSDAMAAVWINVGTSLGTRVNELFFMDATDFEEKFVNGRSLGLKWILSWCKNDLDSKGYVKGIKHAQHCMYGCGKSKTHCPNFENPSKRCSACILLWWFGVLKRKDPSGCGKLLFRELVPEAKTAGIKGLVASDAALEPKRYNEVLRDLVERANVVRKSVGKALLDISRATSHGLRRGAVTNNYRLMQQFPGCQYELKFLD